jgi:hypothetical protein
MRMLSPIHSLKKRHERRRRLRTALHMLSVSGVLRAGHIEPRYFEPSSQVDALSRHENKRQQAVASTSAGSHFQLSAVGFDWSKLRQLALTMKRPAFR